jgi:outer membrane receptor protein involved in Fe transport
MRRYILLPLAFACAPAFAEKPEIIVTGTGLSTGAGDAAYDVVTIDRDRLTGSASGRLEDILRDAAGFQQFRRSDARSAHPTSQGATLRGLGGNASSRALILLDGVPQADPFGGWVSWSAFDPTRLGLIRVTRGGGSGAYGPGALAGTIELMSAGPTQLSPLWGGFAYGSRDSVDADLGLSAPLGGGFASLSANYARGDGFTPIVAAARGPADRPAPYEQASAAARAVIPIGAETELHANGLLMLDKRDRGVDFTDNRNIGADASLRLVGKGAWGWEALAYLQMREFSSEFASVTPVTRTTATQALDQYNVPATGIGARFEIRPPIGEAVQLRLGADGRQTQGQTKEHYFFTAGIPANGREAGGRTRMLGGFADLSIEPTDALTITGGARIDRWWIENGFLHQHSLTTGAVLAGSTEYPDRSGWEPTGRAGIAFRPTSAITLRSAGYLGWRLPTLNELYRPFRVGNDTTNANAFVKPERLKGIDAGIDYRLLSIVHLGATIFYNKLDKAIANVTTNPLVPNVRQRQNLDAIRSQGVELEAGIDIAHWGLSASYSYVDAKVRASGAAANLDGLRPAQTPRHQASTTLAYAKPAGPGASVTLRYIGHQYEDDQNSRTLKDALTLDAAAAIPLMAGLALDLRAENLANARVEATNSGAGLIERATPRTLWVGLRYGG